MLSSNRQAKTLEEQKQSQETHSTLRGTRFLWNVINADRSTALALASACNLSFPVASALVARGFLSADQVGKFLFSSRERDVASPELLTDAKTAVERIRRAIHKKEKILIFGDYDVDGITATTIAMLALIPLKARINYFLPNRVKDGYGLSRKIVNRAADAGFTLIITVDNGITAHDAALAAKEHKIDLIITDHHQQSEKLPEALAVVDPHRKDCTYPNKELCGAGVIFKVMSLMYEQLKMDLPTQVYELLALGTIADVVPLVRENRYWVRRGIAQINENMSFQIACLAQNNKIQKSKIWSRDIAFGIVPQINALGRLHDPRDAVRFLLTSDQKQIVEIANNLKAINERRKAVEAEILDEIEREIELGAINLSTDHVIFSAKNNWPSGVIGLVAGRLMNRHGRPTFLFHLGDDGIARGSCRSIDEFNVFEALSEHKNILKSFGGHACAAGLSLEQKNLPELKKRLTKQVAKKFSIQDLQPKLTIDAPLELTETNKKLIRDLETLEPYGNQNPAPLFIIKDVTLIRPPQLLKGKHVKCMVFSQGVIKPIIFFNRPDLINVLENIGEKSFCLAAHPVKNEWNGTVTIELQGIDLSLNNTFSHKS